MSPSTFLFTIAFLVSTTLPVMAQDKAPEPNGVTPQSLMQINLDTIATIEETRWRNQAYRDLAISMAFADSVDGGINLIEKIDNPDTQAMTIRAIGMAKAIHQDLTKEEYQSLFSKLSAAAELIEDEGARDIAYTYIAMAQAFAGLDEDATITTQGMTNDALRYKAYGETAEIQAERGDYNSALQSINAINSVAFKNKALGLVSERMIKHKNMDKAFEFAQMITNPTKKVEAIQKIIDVQIGLDQPK